MSSQRKPQLTFAAMAPVFTGAIVVFLGLCFRDHLAGFLISSGTVVLALGLYTVAKTATDRQDNNNDDTVSFHRTGYKQ